MAERPYLIELQALAFEISVVRALICVAGVTYVSQELDDRILCDARHANNGANRHTFAQRCEDLNALLNWQPIHAIIILHRSSIFKLFRLCIAGNLLVVVERSWL